MLRTFTIKNVIGIICLCTAIHTANFSAPAWCAAQGNRADAFEQGNRACAAGKYSEALTWYEQAEKEKGISAALLYNRGNAYYHKKEIGRCILSYERALLLEPGNADIRANLALARQDFGLHDPPAPWWRTATSAVSLNQWTWLASGALSVLSILLLLRGVAIATGRRNAGLMRYFGVASFCCAALFFTAAGGLALEIHAVDRAVVLGHDARLLVSPFDTAAQSAPLCQGRTVAIKKTHGDYAFIQDAAGNSGWVEQSALAPLVPCDGQG